LKTNQNQSKKQPLLKVQFQKSRHGRLAMKVLFAIWNLAKSPRSFYMEKTMVLEHLLKMAILKYID
tara:strand:+ start:88 stop:285 length:198 start_codon:yes stop_codon:yes gene_type:complete